MAKKPIPTPDRLRQLFRYDPETGDLFWLPRSPDDFHPRGQLPASAMAKTWNTQYAGKLAGYVDPTTGYLRAHVIGHYMYAHRIIWAIHYGEHPTNLVDHANGNKTDNRLCNLRAATWSENQQNRRAISKVKGRLTSSQYCGVHLKRRSNRWIAKIRSYEPGKGSVQHELGSYGCQTAAALAYDAAAKRLHGQFARTNF